MIDNLPRWQRRSLALAVLVLICGLVFMLTAAPLMSLNTHYMDNIERLQQRLQILQRKAARGEELRARHDQLQRLLASNRHYLKSATEALAAADLQGIVKRVAATHRMEVISTQILPGIQEQGFNGVTLKVRMRGKLDNLVRAFHALETGKPYLMIDNLSIRSRVQNSRKIDLQDGKNAAYIKVIEILDVDFDITGYMPQPT